MTNTKIENLKDLFLVQGREMYDIANQVQNELPAIKDQVSNPDLRAALEREITSAKEQCNRINAAFTAINEAPTGETSESLRSLLKRTRSLINQSQEKEVRDAAVINAIQQINHSNIAGLGSLSAYAKEIGHDTSASSFHECVEMEKDIDEELSKIAWNRVNREAVYGSSEQIK